MKTEIDREDDGRWIAEVPDLPAVLGLRQEPGGSDFPGQGAGLACLGGRPKAQSQGQGMTSAFVEAGISRNAILNSRPQ
jgi:hypothetical protein